MYLLCSALLLSLGFFEKSLWSWHGVVVVMYPRRISGAKVVVISEGLYLDYNSVSSDGLQSLEV